MKDDAVMIDDVHHPGSRHKTLSSNYNSFATVTITSSMSDDQREEKDLREAVQFSVIQICAQEETHSRARITPQAINAIAELTYLYATTCLRNDYDVFSTHAGRKTIHEVDVKLMARKNPDNLRDLLNQYAQEHFTAPKAAPSKSRKKEVLINLDKNSLSSSDDEILGVSSKRIADKPLPPPSDSSLSSAEDDCFKLPVRPSRKQKLSVDDDDSSGSSVGNSKPVSRISSFQPPLSAGGTRIKDILDQLSQDSFDDRKDMDTQE